MKTVVLDPAPVELARLIERRKRLGLDRYDEVWEGVYHMAPAPRYGHAYLDDELTRILRPHAEAAGLAGSGPFNLGHHDDFRVLDHGYHRGRPDPEAVYLDTAALVVEIVSPGDETYDKLPFYAARGVDEVLIVEPTERRIRILALARGHYEDIGSSAVLDVDVDQIQAAVRWL